MSGPLTRINYIKRVKSLILKEIDAGNVIRRNVIKVVSDKLKISENGKRHGLDEMDLRLTVFEYIKDLETAKTIRRDTRNGKTVISRHNGGIN